MCVVFSVLKKVTIETKVFSLMSISLVLILIFSLDKMYDLHRTSSQMKNIQQHMEHAPYVSTLIHELQRERGLSAGYLGSNQEQAMRSALEEQFTKTNTAIVATNININNSNLELGASLLEPKFWGKPEALLQLSFMREDILNKNLSHEKSCQYYIQVIEELLRSLKKLNSLQQDPDMVKQVAAYIAILEMKEHAGQERSHGTIGFGMGRFSKELYKDFVSAVSDQKTFLTVFNDNASLQDKALYEETIQGSQIEILAHIEQQIFQTFDNPNTSLFSSLEWFELISFKIDKLHILENELSAALLTHVSGHVQDAKRDFWIVAIIFTALAVSTIYVCLILVRSIFSSHNTIKSDALDKSERYSKLIQASLRGICETDLKGKIEAINPAGIKMFGGNSEEDFIGVYFVDLVASKDQSKVIKFIKEALENVTSFVEFEARKAKPANHLSSCILPALADRPSVSRLMILTEDITVKKQEAKDLLVAKTKAETALKAKTRFIANMNHELRTPLSHILGFAQLLQQKPRSVEDQEMLGYVISGGEELLDKVKAIVELSNQAQAEIATFSLTGHPHIVSALEKFEKKVRLQDKAFDIIGLEKTFLAKGDSECLLKAIDHILDNALKFTSAKDRITFEFCEEAGFAVVKISDTGPGIPSALLKKVTLPFEVLDSSFSRSCGGMGLGLAASKQLMLNSNGLLEIQSILGKGTSVSLKVPLALYAEKLTDFVDNQHELRAETTSRDEYSREFNERFI